MNDREKYLEDARNSSWNLFDADNENEIVVGNESTLSQELTDLYQEIEERR